MSSAMVIPSGTMLFFVNQLDQQVISPGELADLYERAVGGNTILLFNLPPDRRGLIHKHDARLNDASRCRGSHCKQTLVCTRHITRVTMLSRC